MPAIRQSDPNLKTTPIVPFVPSRLFWRREP
jgi:hypothetical protein